MEEALSYFKTPVTDPVLVFTIVLLIILLVPVFLRKIRIPSIVGFIIAGVAFGPFGLNILERNSAIILFGTVGLIYIMFLAGLDLDFNEFKKSRHKSIFFGILTFAFPFFLGLPVCLYILDLDMLPAILVSSMFSTHTLVAYPIASRLGVTRTVPVMLAVGGTIITDVVVLLILAIVVRTEEGTAGAGFWLQLIVSLIVFSFIVFWSFPKIARWFLKNMESEKTIQYIFVLTLLFIAAFLSKLAGIEPILGAFVAGITLNKLIPHTSALMNRIEFVGNALFIPFFLISVGMLVDLRVLFNGWEAFIVIVVLSSAALLGKWLAAFFTQKAFRFTRDQRQIIFGLSSSHAAATLAVITIGYNIGLVNINVLNGTIVLVFVTCLVASFVTEKAARRIAKTESAKAEELPAVTEKILVSIYNPSTIERLMDLAIMLQKKKSKESIYTLSVVRDDDEAKVRVVSSNKMLQQAIQHASVTDHRVQVITRIDVNVSSGISRSVKELLITCVIMGWSDRIKAGDKIFGTILTNILNSCNQMLWVCRIQQSLNTFNKIIVLVPSNAEYEIGFIHLYNKIIELSAQIGEGVTFCCTEETRKNLVKITHTSKPGTEFQTLYFDDWVNLSGIPEIIHPNHLLIVISARRGTLSYQNSFQSLPDRLPFIFEDKSLILIFPEQSDKVSGALNLDGMDTFDVQQNLNLIGKLGRLIRNIFSR
jgi:Kef-type K+ transport system membrane component KefB